MLLKVFSLKDGLILNQKLLLCLKVIVVKYLFPLFLFYRYGLD